MADQRASGPARGTAVEPAVGSEPDPGAPAGEPAEADEKQPVERRAAPRENSFGHAPWVLALSSLGVLLVALGYAGGRYLEPHAIVLYWAGQVVVFTPVVIRLLSRRLAGVAESFTLVIGLAVNQYLLKWMYSPDQLRFPDELQHWLATTIINESGQLFRPNVALPPAVHFPGLAEMGAAVSQLTGLPVTAAGLLVAGVAHLCFVGALYAATLRASRSAAVAGVTCAIYATALHYLFFSSMYLYQSAALPFLMLTVWAERRWRTRGGRPFLVVAAIGVVMTTVSHHVTAGALVLTLLLLAVTEVVTVRPRPWRALITPAAALLVVIGWIVFVARDVIGYLQAPLTSVMRTLSSFVGDSSDAASVAPAVSYWQLGVQGAGLLALAALWAAVGRDMIARSDRDPWRWAAIAGAGIFFAGNGVRFLGANGPEIAGRLSTFTYVPMSLVAAIALVQAVRVIPPRIAGANRWRLPSPPAPALRPGRTVTRPVLVGATMITVLMIGARAGGWPPPDALLPGPYLAAAFERSVDAYGVTAADWERTTLGPGNRVGGDIAASSLASTYGRQDPVRQVGRLFYDEPWSDADTDMVNRLAIGYLVVDKRISELLPSNEAYFDNDPHAGRITRPLTAEQIGKFDSLPQVDRLYDNGVVRIYRMGAW